MRDQPPWYDPAYESARDRQSELETAGWALCKEIYGPLDADRAKELLDAMPPKYLGEEWRLWDHERDYIRQVALEELEVGGVVVEWDECIEEPKAMEGRAA